MTAPAPPLPIDIGLLRRYRDAGAKIAWRPAGGAAHTEIAHLNDEEARVERTARGRRARVRVDAGPLGALVVLLEADRRGLPERLGAEEAGRDAAFPAGTIVAGWGGAPVPTDARPKFGDLVELARYALA